MWREILRLWLTILVIGAAVFAGCSKEENQVINPNPTTTGGTGFPTGGGTGLGGTTGSSGTGGTNGGSSSGSTGTPPAPPPFTSGETETLIPANNAAFSQFVSARSNIGRPNNPGPINANFDFSPYGSNPTVFLGFFTLQYYDSPFGVQRLMSIYTDNGYPVWNTDKGNDVNTLYMQNGQPVIRLFAQDRFGAVILILRPGKGGSDSNIGLWTAKVYFYNFTNPTAPNPRYDTAWILDPYYGWQAIAPNPKNTCWSTLIKDGPYRCKNFDIDPVNSGKWPFTLLGTVKNIDLSKALGG